MHWIEKIAKGLLQLTLFSLIVVASAVSLSLLPSVGKYRIFVVQSGSMEPAIKTGSLILVQPKGAYSVGDVVTRKTDQSSVTITHRIVSQEVKDGKLVFATKGDANGPIDSEAVPQSNIIGKETIALPYLGYGVNFAKTPAGFFFVILLPALLIIVDEILNIRKVIQRNRFEKREAKRKRNEVKAFDPDFAEVPLSKTIVRNIRIV
jgi:signal peptidase